MHYCICVGELGEEKEIWQFRRIDICPLRIVRMSPWYVCPLGTYIPPNVYVPSMFIRVYPSVCISLYVYDHSSVLPLRVCPLRVYVLNVCMFLRVYVPSASMFPPFLYVFVWLFLHLYITSMYMSLRVYVPPFACPLCVYFPLHVCLLRTAITPTFKSLTQMRFLIVYRA